jgi:hypothetical protein
MRAKNDQEGVKSEFTKFMYASPVIPELCPILALVGFYFLVRHLLVSCPI